MSKKASVCRVGELQPKNLIRILCSHAIPEQQERVRLLESTACYHTPRRFYLPPKMPAPKRVKQRNPPSLSLYRLRTRVFLQSYWMQVCKSNLTILSLQYQTLLMKVQHRTKICYCRPSKQQRYHGRTQRPDKAATHEISAFRVVQPFSMFQDLRSAVLLALHTLHTAHL